MSLACFSPCPGEEKLNILEIVKPVETVEVVIDPDAAGEEGALVEEGQLIAVDRSSLTDETSEQVTRWAAALEGYRKEQVRLGIPYGKEQKPTSVCVCERERNISYHRVKQTRLLMCEGMSVSLPRPCSVDTWSGDPLGCVGDEGIQHRRDGNRQHPHSRPRAVRIQPRTVPAEGAQWRNPLESPGASTKM